MKLKDFLNKNNLSVYQFAFLSKLSVPVIYRVLRDERIAPKTARKLLSFTKNEVDYTNIRSFSLMC